MSQSHVIRNAYRQSENQAEIHPVKLIFMMYERVITHLELAAEGIEQDDPKLRGENLGRAIAIITELNASIKEKDESEAAQFLRGLYSAVLTELPKVSVSSDLDVLSLAKKYMVKIKDVWQETAMEEAGFNNKPKVGIDLDEYIELKPLHKSKKSKGGPVGSKEQTINRTGLSVAI